VKPLRKGIYVTLATGTLCFFGRTQSAEFIGPHQLRVRIQPGDTLSQALDRCYPDRNWRIWGSHGLLKKIAKINPDVPDLNRVKPKQEIQLGDLVSPSCVSKIVEGPRPASVTDISAQPTSNLVLEPSPTPAPISSPAVLPSAQNTAPPMTGSPVAAGEPPNPANPDRFGLLNAEASFSYSRAEFQDKVTGAQAALVSTLNSGARLSWDQHWSNQAQSSLHLGIDRVSYSANDGSYLDSSSHTLTQFGFGFRLTPSEHGRLAILLDAGSRQYLFARGVSYNSNTLDVVSVPYLSGGLSLRVAQFWPMSMSLYGKETYLFPTKTEDYAVSSGSGYEVGANLIEVISRSVRLIGEFGYASSSQNTSIETQTYTEMRFSLGISFHFDSPQEPRDHGESEL
jgi:hypothetical protein